jgi:hypothetical protein
LLISQPTQRNSSSNPKKLFMALRATVDSLTFGANGTSSDQSSNLSAHELVLAYKYILQ